MTPIAINIQNLQTDLIGYPAEKKNIVVNGLIDGFKYDLRYLPTSSFECRNLRSCTVTFPGEASRLLQLEMDKGYVMGPYEQPPEIPYRVNPLGVVEGKYSGKRRLIMDMSAPHEMADTESINELMSKEYYSLSYVKLDDAIKAIQMYGPGAWLCKTDIADAFKQLPLHPTLWPYHVVKLENKYYCYTRLVFGSRASPKLFDTFASAVAWILENKYSLGPVLHLLDDFLLV